MTRTKYLAAGLFACHSATAPSPSPATSADGAAPTETIVLTPAAPPSEPVMPRAAEPPSRSPAALEAIPVAASETLIVSLPMRRPSGKAVTITHPGYCHIGYPISFELAWANGSGDETVELALSGPDTNETQSIQLRGPQRVSFKTVIARDGRYLVTARARNLVDTMEIVTVENGTMVHAPGRPPTGDFVLVARGAVRGQVGTSPAVLRRGRYDRGAERLVVDVSMPIRDEAALERASAQFGKPVTIAGPRGRDSSGLVEATVYVRPSGARTGISWLTRPNLGPDTIVIHIDAPTWDDEVRKAVESFVAMYPPLPAPLQIGSKARSRCTADVRHCCLPDGRTIAFEGCQPSYREAPGAFVKGPDGFCKSIPCTLKCLPAEAAIATPRGEVPVSRLREGDIVWTVTTAGGRIAAPLRRVVSNPIAGSHEILVITLGDGRVVRGSAGHPTADGRTLDDLKRGEAVDGAEVTSVRTLPITGATWDILPDGPSGTYWADGVLIGSTLREGK
jgi:hypothetical protein